MKLNPNDRVYLKCSGGPLDGESQWWHPRDVDSGVVTWITPPWVYPGLINQIHEYVVDGEKAVYRGVREAVEL